MAMSPRLLRPITSGDADARRYIAAVQAADQNTLEPAVRKAITDFIVGCKADGIWGAIKASCILMGARTLAGALTPLVGPAASNASNNFVTGDYNRQTGLFGDGNPAANKRIDTGFNGYDGTTPPIDDFHLAYYAHTREASTSQLAYITHLGAGNTGGTQIFANNLTHITRNRSSGAETSTGVHATGFTGMNRASGTGYTFRSNGTDTAVTRASQTPSTNTNVFVFGNSGGGGVQARLSFYSAGTSLSLSALDARVSALATAIAAAIP